MDEEEYIKQEIQELESKVQKCRDNPQIVADDKLSGIRSSLEQVEEREPDNENHISMHQHLKYEERALKQEPEQVVQREADSLEQRMTQLKSELEEMRNGNN